VESQQAVRRTLLRRSAERLSAPPSHRAMRTNEERPGVVLVTFFAVAEHTRLEKREQARVGAAETRGLARMRSVTPSPKKVASANTVRAFIIFSA
jgi:hypothetical protein